MREVYAMVPVDRMAAAVTSQTRCTGENLTDEQLRENLVLKLKMAKEHIKLLPKKSDLRKRLGQEIQDIQNEIRAIRPKRKAPGAASYFVDVAREVLSEWQFGLIMAKAAERMRENAKEGE